MTQEEILQGNKLILEYMNIKTPFDIGLYNLVDLTLSDYRYDISWEMLHTVIDQINSIGKEISFAIFKTYVSLTVEKGGKFYKDFSFAHAEYITSEQTGKEAAFKLIVKFVKWQAEKNLENNQ